MRIKALINVLVIILACVVPMSGMEYGLRFKSHPFPANERTSLTLGNHEFPVGEEIAFGFELGFYDKDRFGLICTATGNDGTTISLVSSSVDGGYQPGIVINEKLNLIPVEFDATPENPQHPVIIIRRNENKVIFVYDRERYTFNADLSKMKSVRIGFGKLQTQATVAPIEIQDVRIYQEAKNTRKWELRQHRGDSVFDDLDGDLAVSASPHWLLDDHIDWTEIYSLHTAEEIQTAFDPEKEIFYIVAPSRITEFNPLSGSSVNIPVAKDGRVMKYSNYLVFDTITDRLLSYSLSPKQTNTFDFSTKKWEKDIQSDMEPHFSNHGFTTDGRNAYMFGGYGFYLYTNNLVRLNLLTGGMEEIALHPLPDPRTSSALCVANGKLYLFGGMGNSVGKQEIPSRHYFDLWEYDLDTMKGKKLWECDTASNNFLPSASMYYTPKDTCFYLASTLSGGCMMRIYPNRPGYEVVSGNIHSKMDYRDCVFNLYRSANGRNYYLVIDKRLNDFSHDYAIYFIAYPFRDTLLYDSFKPSGRSVSGSNDIWWWIGGGLLFLCCVGAVAFLMRRRRSVAKPEAIPPVETETLQEAPEEASQMNEEPEPVFVKEATSKPEPAQTPLPTPEPVSTPTLTAANPPCFDRDKSAISLLGAFSVRDREGNDITPRFTSRIKDLLILLVLYSEKDPKGVSYETLDEVIWFDKDEKAAKNNRNVYMSKLRILLEEVGNIEISFVKGYYRVESGNVTIDYHEIMTRLREKDIEGEADSRRLDEILELLLHGPLLPEVANDWIDSFKSNYTSTSIQILSKELERDDIDSELRLRIADSILLHDPLSEEAMMAKCRILTERRMKGVAKNLYDIFCREYEKSYGEKYTTAFSEIVN